MKLRDKKALVFGLARSGAGAANLLAHLGAEVTVTDKKTKEELAGFVQRLSPSVKTRLGGHPSDVFNGIDLIVVSPGVPLDIQPLKVAREKGIKIIGELELAYQIIRESGAAFLGVTGTNGKSTTTMLLGLMMKKGGFNTIVGGNIGNALTEEIYERIGESANRGAGEVSAPDIGVDYIVAEISSFQLESIESFRPKGSTILNITPDHLDRYRSMDEYRDAKARVFLNQGKDDFIVLNADDEETMKVKDEKFPPPGDSPVAKKAESEGPHIFYFSRKKTVEGVCFKDGVIYSRFNSPLLTLNSQLMRASDIRIKGVHNLENAMAASAMALLAKCPVEAVVGALREFPGLEHRLEFVRELDGVSYINDSKGTNVGAVIKSLESFPGPLILIAGGRDKAGDFSILRPLVKDRVKMLVLIGEASGKIEKALGDLTETKRAGSLEEAINISRRSASGGDVVLLSPACASFDMFRDFEDRGEQFKKIVRGIA